MGYVLNTTPVITYGLDGRPVHAAHLGDQVRAYRAPQYGRVSPRRLAGICASRGCDQPAVVDRSVHAISGVVSWRAMCREHALRHAERLGESLGTILRQMVA